MEHEESNHSVVSAAAIALIIFCFGSIWVKTNRGTYQAGRPESLLAESTGPPSGGPVDLFTRQSELPESGLKTLAEILATVDERTPGEIDKLYNEPNRLAAPLTERGKGDQPLPDHWANLPKGTIAELALRSNLWHAQTRALSRINNGDELETEYDLHILRNWMLEEVQTKEARDAGLATEREIERMLRHE